MKKSKILSVFILGVVFMLSMFYCSSGQHSNEQMNNIQQNAILDYEKGRVSIQNGLDKDIVAFTNEINKNNYIDTVEPFEEKTYKLHKDGFYTLKFVYKEDYESDEIGELNPIFIDFLYYKENGEKHTTYVEHNENFGGEATLTCINKTSKWIVLHNEYKDGQILGVLPPFIKESEVEDSQTQTNKNNNDKSDETMEKTDNNHPQIQIELKLKEYKVIPVEYDSTTNKKFKERSRENVIFNGDMKNLIFKKG